MSKIPNRNGSGYNRKGVWKSLEDQSPLFITSDSIDKIKLNRLKPCRDTGSSENNALKCRLSTISKATAQHPLNKLIRGVGFEEQFFCIYSQYLTDCPSVNVLLGVTVPRSEWVALRVEVVNLTRLRANQTLPLRPLMWRRPLMFDARGVHAMRSQRTH